MSEELVHLHNVSVGYDEPLIEGINIEIFAGDVIAVLGPSGIGKTSLLRTIAGLIRPLAGEVELAVPSRGGLGYIPQRLGLVGNLTVRGNVEMGTRVGLSRWYPPFVPVPSKQRNYVDQAMVDLGIDHLAEQPVRILSGGQQRRVATAKTVAQRPKLVLADEFLGELDDDNVDIVMRTVNQAIKAENSAMIMVEHHEELAKGVANRIWRITGGRLVEELKR
ncbi:MAG: ATP-binding cassette domain-containing protein [Candidatus Poseidonia sp.]|nr:ATP-binding cassette domain-containing protein [Poseidonia sp.]MBL6747739.1 ATP-binding cassette domain-containing protein [Poseidonia sp.]MBL6806226.1 ATP-binding cassette domain-containing protein [Poseidonia sp.]MBL6886399.1 ATP-binding cassette domain-containing protein [Poseidonia sp.]MBL6892421.1 ATP-binding cassette domain-containing protein [Poseidonia sp.]